METFSQKKNIRPGFDSTTLRRVSMVLTARTKRHSITYSLKEKYIVQNAVCLNLIFWKTIQIYLSGGSPSNLVRHSTVCLTRSTI